MIPKNVRSAIIIVLVFAVGFTWGIRLGPQIPFFDRYFPNDITTGNDEFDMIKLQSIYNTVMQNHIDPDLDSEAMLVNAIKGMLRVVDGGYTRFETAEEHERTSERSIGGVYAGIGVIVSMQNNQVVVVAPYRGTPADQAGVRPGDIILGVDDTSVTGLDLHEVSNMIRGPVGTTVMLTLIREGEQRPLEIFITRENIEIPVTEHSVKGDVGIVQLVQFNLNSKEQLQRSIEEVKALGAKALILDLRGNPGGSLGASFEVVDLFLPATYPIVRTIDRQGNEEVAYTRSNNPITMPMVVMIDKGSASASEIVAGALRDHERAMIIGVHSFGKASVQQGYPLDDGSMLWITTKTYLTPSGENIDKMGIRPDIIIPNPDVDTTEWSHQELDTYQLEMTIEWVQGNLL